MNIQQAMINPHATFASPERLADSKEFSKSQKSAILLQWKDQLTKLLIADEEGMLRTDAVARMNTGVNADCLQRVTIVMSRLSR